MKAIVLLMCLSWMHRSNHPCVTDYSEGLLDKFSECIDYSLENPCGIWERKHLIFVRADRRNGKFIITEYKSFLESELRSILEKGFYCMYEKDSNIEKIELVFHYFYQDWVNKEEDFLQEVDDFKKRNNISEDVCVIFGGRSSPDRR